jgi:hypothetical protein
MYKRALTLVMVLACLIGCSPSKPSDDEIIAAIKDSLQKGIPIEILFQYGGRNVQIEMVEASDVKIETYGEYNKEGKYWPVIATIKGRITSNRFIGNYVINNRGKFKIYYDDFKKVTAQLLEPKLSLIN